MVDTRSIKRQTLEVVAYYSVLVAIQIVLLALWRRVDTTSFIFIPICITTAAAVLMVELTLFFKPVFAFNASAHRGIRIVGALSFCFTVFTCTVLNIDRSRSLLVVKWVDNYGDVGITLSDLKATAHARGETELAMVQRLNEQIEVGTIVTNESGNYLLTSKGKFVTSVADAFAEIFNLQNFKTGTQKIARP